MPGALIREEFIQTHRGEGEVTVEAEIGVTRTQALKVQRLPVTPGDGGGEEGPSPGAFRERARPCPLLDFRLLASRTIHFCCFKIP